VYSRAPRDISDLWKHGHIRDYPIFWKASGKEELKTRAKVTVGDIRVFNPSDAGLSYYMRKLFTDQNKRMHYHGARTLQRNYYMIGFTKQHRGYDDLVQKLKTSFPTPLTGLREGDVKKWDKDCREFLFEKVKRWRFKMFLPSLQTDELWQRISWVYKQVVHSYMVAPGGRVLQKHASNPSGSDNTGDDNDLMHDWVMAYSFFDAVDTEDFMDYAKNVQPCLYGDDHIVGTTNYVEKVWTLKTMEKSYRDCGFTLKAESSFETTLEQVENKIIDDIFLDHTFLGSRIGKFCTHGHEYYIGIPEGQKALGAICHSPREEKGELGLNQIYTRVCSLEVEYFFSNKREALRSLANFLEEQGARFRPEEVVDAEFWFSVPMARRFTYNEIISLYLDLEQHCL